MTLIVARRLKDLLTIFLALVGLATSLLFMPWAELNFGWQFPPWLRVILVPIGVPKIFQELQPLADKIRNLLLQAGAENHFGDYAYMAFLALAMIAAAIAIHLIGREEAEEKTLLPQKK
jgi:hypothetical protein